MKRIRFELWYARRRVERRIEAAQMWLVWRLPSWVIYWACIRANCKAWVDAGDKTPNELTFNEVMDAAKSL